MQTQGQERSQGTMEHVSAKDAALHALMKIMRNVLFNVLRRRGADIEDVLEVVPYVYEREGKTREPIIDFRVYPADEEICAVLLGRDKRNISRIRTDFMPMKADFGIAVKVTIIDPRKRRTYYDEQEAAIGDPD